MIVREITWNSESHVTFTSGMCVDITKKYHENNVEILVKHRGLNVDFAQGLTRNIGIVETSWMYRGDIVG